MSNQVIHALYDDDDTLLSAVKEVRAKSITSKKYIPLSSSRSRQSHGTR